MIRISWKAAILCQRRCIGELRMAWKKVTLVNNDKAIYTLSFLV